MHVKSKRLSKCDFFNTSITIKLFSRLITTGGQVNKRGIAHRPRHRSQRVVAGPMDRRQTKLRCFSEGSQCPDTRAWRASSIQDHHRKLPDGTRSACYVVRGSSSSEDQNQDYPVPIPGSAISLRETR